MVGIKEGELTRGQPASILRDLPQYHVDVTVDEINIGRVTEGQPVTITLDALPGEVLAGTVDMIADSAQLDSGVVTYNVAPAWSPDGRYLAFLPNRDGPWHIQVMKADGSRQRPMFGGKLDDLRLRYEWASERVISWTQ